MLLKKKKKPTQKTKTKSSPKTLNTKAKNFGIWAATEINVDVDSLTFSIILLNTSGRKVKSKFCAVCK